MPLPVLLLLALPPWLAAAPWWAAVPWGSPLSPGLEPERDHPWAASLADRCAWSEGLLLCEGPAGVDRAYRPHAEPVAGGERRWLRTAGLEWRSGWTVPSAAPEGMTSARWGQHHPPYEGWDWVTPAPRPPAPRAPREVHVEGLQVFGPEAPAVAAALAACLGPPVERLPLVVLYDPTGEARLVRVQAFLTEELDGACIAAAVGGPRRPPGVERHVELMVSLGL